MNTDVTNIIENIRTGEIDINNQELFFSTVIKGLMLKLDDDIMIRNKYVPHIIVHTGDDIMYLENKEHNMSVEPLSISNESYPYSVVPRCIVTPGGINLVQDQLTNPYTLGQFQYEGDNNNLSLTAEFRRLPVKLNIELKYLTDSYRDLLELTQQILTKLSFIKTYYITYMGQMINCSYYIPDTFDGEYLTDLDGTTQESKNKTLTINIEVETNLPIISNKTVMLSDKYIKNYQHNITT